MGPASFRPTGGVVETYHQTHPTINRVFPYYKIRWKYFRKRVDVRARRGIVGGMKLTNEPTMETLKSLKAQHKTQWLTFFSKLEKVLEVMASRTGVTWGTQEDIRDHVIAEDFVAAGFTEAEAAALVFVLTEDCQGRPVESVETVDRWFCYEMP